MQFAGGWPRGSHENSGMPADLDKLTSMSRWRLGLRSARRLGLAAFGSRWTLNFDALRSPDRAPHGLCVILPGIEGRSTVNDGIAEGLVAGGFGGQVEIHDWTLRGWPDVRNLWQLRRNLTAARELADRITMFRSQHPAAPVFVIGHSGGGGMALFVLRQLKRTRVSRVILLAAAVSSTYPVRQYLHQTERGISNFFSRGDYPTVGIGTWLFRTMDGHRAVSAGAIGFSNKVSPADAPPLTEVPYRLAFARDWNFGGHLGCTNSAFIATHVVPLLGRADEQ